MFFNFDYFGFLSEKLNETNKIYLELITETFFDFQRQET
jgi:hypothetical protein